MNLDRHGSKLQLAAVTRVNNGGFVHGETQWGR